MRVVNFAELSIAEITDGQQYIFFYKISVFYLCLLINNLELYDFILRKSLQHSKNAPVDKKLFARSAFSASQIFGPNIFFGMVFQDNSFFGIRNFATTVLYV
jgi:hypothetical protein